MRLITHMCKHAPNRVVLWLRPVSKFDGDRVVPPADKLTTSVGLIAAVDGAVLLIFCTGEERLFPDRVVFCIYFR